LTLVPETVVRDLREQCVDRAGDRRPAPILMLDVFRDAHRQDDGSGSVTLSSLSDVNQGRPGYFYIDPSGPPLGSGSDPRLAALIEAFGAPRRSGCRAHWPRVALWATACTADHVTKLALRAPWRLEPDGQDFTTAGRATVRVGDRVSLARYLDPRLRKLPAHAHCLLPRMQIATTTIVVTVVTRRGRITEIKIDIQQDSAAAPA
jgi:hypothetical protein